MAFEQITKIFSNLIDQTFFGGLYARMDKRIAETAKFIDEVTSKKSNINLEEIRAETDAVEARINKK